jgi:hypothetical protein
MWVPIFPCFSCSHAVLGSCLEPHMAHKAWRLTPLTTTTSLPHGVTNRSQTDSSITHSFILVTVC